MISGIGRGGAGGWVLREAGGGAGCWGLLQEVRGVDIRGGGGDIVLGGVV